LTGLAGFRSHKHSRPGAAIFLYFDIPFAISSGQLARCAGRVAEASPVYRPRHPERTPFYQLFDRHFDRYLAEYEERYEPRFGSLRAVVPRTVSAFLECGEPNQHPCRATQPGHSTF
jgi:hypothetical protein